MHVLYVDLLYDLFCMLSSERYVIDKFYIH